MLPQTKSIALTVGAGQIERVISNAGELLRQYRVDTGADYLDYTPITNRDQLFPEDIAVTLLVNSRAGWRAVQSMCQFGAAVDLTVLPDKPLEQTTAEERRVVAQLVARMAQWPGFASSLATKVLHKKRPSLIPILDNQAIFGAYMNLDWPGRLARTDSIKDESTIRRALDWIAFDLIRLENAPAWESLCEIEPTRTRTQLFDSVWWMYFRKVQPVHAAGLSHGTATRVG